MTHGAVPFHTAAGSSPHTHTHTHTKAVHRTTSALPSCSAAWFMRVMRWWCCWMRQLLDSAVILPSGGADVHVLNVYAVVLEMLKGNLKSNNLTNHSMQQEVWTSNQLMLRHFQWVKEKNQQQPHEDSLREQINTNVELTHGESPEEGGGARPRLGGALDRWGYSPLGLSERHSWPGDRRKDKGNHQQAGKRMKVTKEM